MATYPISRSRSYSLALHKQGEIKQNGTTTSTMFVRHLPLVVSASLTGQGRTDWRVLKARGVDVTNPLSAEAVLIHPITFHVNVRVNRFSGTVDEDQVVFGSAFYQPTLPPEAPIPPQDLVAAVVGDWVRKAVEAQQSIAGGVFLGELREALSMIRHPARKLSQGMVRYYNTARKLRKPYLKAYKAQGFRKNNAKRRLSRLHQDLASLYLENTYGWQPLLSDIESGVRLLHTWKRKREVIRVTSRKTHRSLGLSSKVSQNLMAGSLAEITTSVQDYYESSYQQVGGVVVKGTVYGRCIDHPTLIENAGLGIRSWVPTVWELLPWSFVVDYFTNVGDVIGSTALTNAQIQWAGTTTRRNTIRVYTVTPEIAATSDNYGALGDTLKEYRVSNPQLRIQVRNVVRSSDYSSTPELTFEVPGVDSQKWLNLAALFAARKEDRHINRRRG